MVGSKSSAWRSLNHPKCNSFTMELVAIKVHEALPMRSRTESSPLFPIPPPEVFEMPVWMPFTEIHFR